MNNWRLNAAVLLSIGLVSCVENQALMDQAGAVARQIDKSGALGKVTGSGEIESGLKEALRVGADSVVARLGRPNGFSLDPKVHIPLPENLRKAKKVAARFGLAGKFDELEQRLNAAAEAATPQAKGLLLDAISNMTLEDAQGILNGPDDAATRYFKDKTSSKLAKEMRPIVEESVSESGALTAYNNLLSGLGPVSSMVPDLKADLVSYVVDKGMDGIFYYLAQEEAAIRRDPAKRTTELLRKVFGNR